MLDHRHPHSDLLLLIDSVGGVPCQKLPEIYFPEDIPDPVVRREAITAARQICDSCPIKRECLEYALDTKQEWGIWAGLTIEELQRISSRN